MLLIGGAMHVNPIMHIMPVNHPQFVPSWHVYDHSTIMCLSGYCAVAIKRELARSAAPVIIGAASGGFGTLPSFRPP